MEEIEERIPTREKSSGPSILKTRHPEMGNGCVCVCVWSSGHMCNFGSCAQMRSPASISAALFEIFTAAGICALGTITEVSSGVQLIDKNSV